jgi:hypothetical protein
MAEQVNSSDSNESTIRKIPTISFVVGVVIELIYAFINFGSFIGLSKYSADTTNGYVIVLVLVFIIGLFGFIFSIVKKQIIGENYKKWRNLNLGLSLSSLIGGIVGIIVLAVFFLILKLWLGGSDSDSTITTYKRYNKPGIFSSKDVIEGSDGSVTEVREGAVFGNTRKNLMGEEVVSSGGKEFKAKKTIFDNDVKNYDSNNSTKWEEQ